MPQSVADLRGCCPAELDEIFRAGKVTHVPIGDLDGQMLYLTDRAGKFKVNVSNLVWRGKYLGEDNYFSNRWIGQRRWIGSYYVIGPSWVDGAPAIVLEYPRGVFANLHDEMREIAPGLLLGTVFDRNPVKFRGYFAVEIPLNKTVTMRPASDVPHR